MKRIPSERDLCFLDGERYDPLAEASPDRWATCAERDVLDRVRADDVHTLDVDRPPPGWARTRGHR